ncbi:DNA-binding protein [Candidatus Gugararchaeum adminiculabundum]|nr:DNA-binding protein [Candidatus Gugararchaeum adminiculabundum]
MDMEELRRRRMQQISEMRQQQQQEEQKRNAMLQTLEPDAYERLMNVRIANEDLYNQVVSTIVYLMRQGNLKGKISNEQLKKVLGQLSASGAKDSKIEFKRK